MRKLSLDLDALAVDSFATAGETGGRGTVRGHDTGFTEFCNTRSCGVLTHCCQGDEPVAPARADEPFE